MSALDETQTYTPFECRCSAAPGFSSVRLRGELDRTTAPRLRRALREAQFANLVTVVDLRALDFMDSGGVRVLIDAQTRAQRSGRRLLVIRGRRRLDHLLFATGADATLELVQLRPEDPPVQALLARPRSSRSSWCPAARTGERPHFSSRLSAP